MTIEEAILKLPHVQRLFAEKTERLLAERERKTAEETRRETVREGLFRVLRKRCGSVPEELAGQLRALQEQQKLDALFDLALECPDLQAIQKALTPS